MCTKEFSATGTLIAAALLRLLVFYADGAEAIDVTPPRYAVDLNAPAENRWTHILREHLDIVPLIAKEAKQYVPSYLQKPVYWLTEKVIHYFPNDYVAELRGIANFTGLPLGEVIGINILYDITDFKQSWFPHIACTAIVAEDSKGRIIHARNLDYDMSDLLRNSTIIVDFVRDGDVVFSATTFLMQVGVLTGQRPGVFSTSLNARYSGGIFDNIFMELLTRFRHPISFSIRQTLEHETNFESAVEKLSTEHFVAPAYILVAGRKNSEGVIITRNRWSAADIYRLDTSKRRWFLLEINDDHWKKAKDPRRKMGIQYMNNVGQQNISPRTIFAIISRQPILNKGTIFSTVMSADEPWLMYNYTQIRNLKI